MNDTLRFDSVWRRMADCPLPLVMYGTGDGAEKITGILRYCGREIECFFSSDDFTGKDRSFLGLPVLKYSQAERMFGNFAVVLGFGSARPEVLRNIRRIAEERLMFVPDLPPAEDPHDMDAAVFTSRTYIENRERISVAAGLLDDELSRRVFSAMLRFRVTGDIRDLDGTASDDLYLPLYHSSVRYETAADLGANRGQSSLEMLVRFPMLKTVVAMEPDERSFRKIGQAVTLDSRIEPHNSAAWHERTVITLMSDGSRGSAAGRSGSVGRRRIRPVNIRAERLDDVLGGRGCQLIHIDVEGGEYSAVSGASDTIARCRPDMMVSAYHRQKDLWEIPLLLHRLMPEKRIHLRRPDALPPWDVICVAEG